MPLYQINSKGGTHRRLEGKEVVVYGNRGREGERNTIELTVEQFESGNFSHLELTPVGEDRHRSQPQDGGGAQNDGGDGDGLDAMKVKDLRHLAAEEGVEIEGDANKATIIEAIRRHRSQPQE